MKIPAYSFRRLADMLQIGAQQSEKTGYKGSWLETNPPSVSPGGMINSALYQVRQPTTRFQISKDSCGCAVSSFKSQPHLSSGLADI